MGFYYDFVKASVDRLVKTFAAELADHPVTAVGVTPGWAALGTDAGELRRHRSHLARGMPRGARLRHLRVPAYVARGVAALAKDSEKHRFAGQVLTARQLAGQYGVTDTDGSRPDCWGLIAKYGWGDQEPEVIRQYR